MDILLTNLNKSIGHLMELDKLFLLSQHPHLDEYLKANKKIKELNEKGDFIKFTNELYVGGKKGGRKKGYARQMILSDIFEYIINGRGYLYAGRSQKNKSIFIKMILNLINQLMILDSLTVNSELRKQFLINLEESRLKNSIFKEEETKKLHEALKQYDGDIGFDTHSIDIPQKVIDIIAVEDGKKAKKELDRYFDSLLPKTAGGLWNELINYLYLLRINAGYVLPLLLNQRILSGGEELLKPPDFLLITYDGEMIGLEVGGGKEIQSGDFAAEVKKMKVATTTNTNVPPRCPICGEWILFCDKVINDYAEIEQNPLLHIKEDIRCAHDCGYYSYQDVIDGKCRYTQYHGKIDKDQKPKQKVKFESDYHYHYSCILKTKDKTALGLIDKQKERCKKYMEKREMKEYDKVPRNMQINTLKANYPYVTGLSAFEKQDKNRLICFGTYRKDMNCEYCDFTKDCSKVKEINSILLTSNISNKEKIAAEIKKLLS